MLLKLNLRREMFIISRRYQSFTRGSLALPPISHLSRKSQLLGALVSVMTHLRH